MKTIEEIQQEYADEIKEKLIELARTCAQNIILNKSNMAGYVFGNSSPAHSTVIFKYYSQKEIINFVTKAMDEEIKDFSKYYKFYIDIATNAQYSLCVKLKQ